MAGSFDTPFEQNRAQLQEDEEQQAQNPETNRAQDVSRRQFDQVKRKAINQAKQKAEQQATRAVEKFAMRGALRVIAIGSAATIIGLVISYAIWTVQIFAGNLMGSKWIPPLELWEIIAWGVVGLVLIILMIFILVMLDDLTSNWLFNIVAKIG